MMSDQFYASIANYYQYIFPFNPEQINFLRNVIPYNGAKILDLGCAIGELDFALSAFGFPVWGIDADAQMIGKARQLKKPDELFPVFEQADMRGLTEHFPEGFFDVALCFGNTLVHLLSEAEIRTFLDGVHKILAPDGKLSIQILNYDYIIDHGITNLPLIDNPHIRFERSYKFRKDSNLIDFNTRLLVKENQHEITNSVQLYPLRKDNLQELLEKSGFEIIAMCGNFNGTPFSETSLPLIVTCQKQKTDGTKTNH